jgi:gas vesicle protein
MSAIRSMTNFGLGALIGAATGAAIGLLFSPGSGEEVRERVRERIDAAKSAGDQAEADTQRELVQKFRLRVRNPDALAEELPAR